jgi:hypothetical protein
MISDIRNQLKKWLGDEGLFQNEAEDSNAHFNFVAKHQNVVFHVYQPLSRMDSILIVCSLNLDAKQKEGITRIEKLELYQRLLSTDCLFEFHPDLDNLNNIRIEDFIFYDGLTKNEFMKTIFRVLKAVQIVNSFMNWEFRKM